MWLVSGLLSTEQGKRRLNSSFVGTFVGFNLMLLSMRYFIIGFIRASLALFALLVLYFNIKLYDAPECGATPNGYVNTDVVRQLHFLRRALYQESAGEAMQNLYPEGYVFSYSLNGLAWCAVAETLAPEAPLRQEALATAARSLRALDSPAGKNVFDVRLPLKYGAFYRGWTAYLRGRLLSLFPTAIRDARQVAQFQEDCAAIARAVTQTEQPYLESYGGAAWPADNIVCLAALSLHDKIMEPRFQSVKKEWLSRIQHTMLPEYELIPHDYDLVNGRSPAGVRGSSQSLMLVFLPEIDSAFAAVQYHNFRKHFLVHRVGLPGIREYPGGLPGSGDIDSGPVVLGIGGAATIVGIKAAQQYQDWDLAVALRNSVETLLFPQESGTEKTYLCGKLPILDAFLAWSNAGICVACRQQTGAWRWTFQVFSVLLLVLCAFLMRRQTK